MRLVVGLVSIFAGLLVAGQVISVIDFRLAQRLGLQEEDGHTDPLVRRIDRNTARWDIASLSILPLAAVLMLRGAPSWRAWVVFGGGAAVDADGREIAKQAALRAEGVAVGTTGEQRLYRPTMALLSLGGLVSGVGGRGLRPQRS